MPRKHLVAILHDGTMSRFEGVTLRELVTRAGVPSDLESTDLTRYVVVEAADGYRALFSLAELDPDPAGLSPILVDTGNGEAIAPEFGPLRLVVPGDSHHSRWVRQAVCLLVGRDSGAQ
jgi:DMSO/TMAO reductase YedYZ molybdopterin-dependent catalytic subunit